MARSNSAVCGAPHTAEFERELTVERIRSGIAAAKARGKRLGRQPGQRPKSDRLAPKVLAQGQCMRFRVGATELADYPARSLSM